jgi:hypothetical protein
MFIRNNISYYMKHTLAMLREVELTDAGRVTSERIEATIRRYPLDEPNILECSYVRVSMWVHSIMAMETIKRERSSGTSRWSSQ